MHSGIGERARRPRGVAAAAEDEQLHEEAPVEGDLFPGARASLFRDVDAGGRLFGAALRCGNHSVSHPAASFAW